jgi:hypothetical protein
MSQTATIVPTMVKFSGTVAGAPSRIVGITFAFYNDQQGRAPLWMETQSVSLDGSGRYNVQLKATLPAGLPKDLFASGEARWLVDPYVGCFKVQTTSASVSSTSCSRQNSPSTRCPVAS